MAATRLLALNWIVAAATAAAVTLGATSAARATDNADDPVSIRDSAVAVSSEVTTPEAAAPAGAARPGPVRDAAGKAGAPVAAAVGGPISDREKIAGSQSERVVREFAGNASWYGPGFHGRRTANGERFDQHELTAAHKTLPFDTRVRVTAIATGRSVIVTINDRGPYIRGRVIDLSAAAATAIGLRDRGVGKVKIEVLEGGPDVDRAIGSRATADREGTAAPRRVTTIIPTN
ncbi:septal ring lytic transglycosylase RlpA family protein [Zavarzinia compransoris]|uniref:Endolytic peptidoglycan transglycosylase RlpA n=1 Tax=Zavarzinia compransoris TaxID=1264899 RepID=A0A317E7N5_9PROT|nr:septal ring lytic transglycosylase RlpA family protein [Zavarzinia compransoris]PWR22294.1 septal ring lytic transglycosylase RlpA family lipoprotein [Zavarzinia compransoris]TDP46942.1 rare lipoprotein A [Zavarzinia compransoris]